MAPTTVRQLRDYGQHAWLDGHVGADELRRLHAAHGICGARVADAAEAAEACDVLLPLWERTAGREGLVSAPVAPGERRHPNLLLAIPADEPARIADTIAAGVSVEAADAVCATRLGAALEAFARGVERLLGRGGDPRTVASVVSVPIAPVDAEVDRRLAAAGAERLRGRFAIANARLAHRHARRAVLTPRWRGLEERGARPPRCLWCATSAAGTGYRDVLYAEELIGPGTLVALAPDTIAAFAGHGVVADRLGRSATGAERVVREVAAAGVDLDAVWRALSARA